MPVFQDQLGRAVNVVSNPQRIVSLVPSQTELLFDLGLGDRVVGRTRFCIHPNGIKSLTSVGGTKDFSLERIEALNPDLIIANKEENERSGILELEKRHPVWVSDVSNLQEALEMIISVGKITGKTNHASQMANQVFNAFDSLNSPLTGNVLYFIWKDPWMVAGKGTFIDDMLHRLGLQNQAPSDRYPELTTHMLNQLNPDHIFLSSEPYPFKEKHIPELRDMFPHAKIRIVNGEYFSWYGSRLLNAPAYFKSL
ncbi:ABC transporter substrate-binding protein [Fulvivirga sedimenti]|uniref:Helical backbone metal receptor n=1 Tax=Fulvivirga sedimenti TaxID=2879465 RepID=A0A9X1HPY1_9BACT|nr:helical backbone metal receptor [Fulvivirga sedimenti]MCA6074174.1 helical backbone metal receptor [Fulvivirga sedimenti]